MSATDSDFEGASVLGLLEEPPILGTDLRHDVQRVGLRIEMRQHHAFGVRAGGDLTDLDECPLPSSYPGGECDVLLRADDIVHDDHAPVQAQIVRKSFRGSEFLYTLRLASGHTVLAHVPSHHDHALGEWIGIRAQVDHVVTFPRG